MSSEYHLNAFHPTLNEINKSLHSDKFNIKNRLLSIHDDHLFVQHVHSSYLKHYPLTANLRCGSWYVYPQKHSCYFKSTDGHFGKWSFNLRRLNPNALKLIIKHHGIIIVDSTRKGKIFPDALQRTIPIWCHVLNNIFHILFTSKQHPSNKNVSLKMPPWIHDSEKQQIEQLANNEWIKNVLSSNVMHELSQIQSSYGKCLRLEPFWIDRFTDLAQLSLHIKHRVASDDIIPIILLTASRPLHALEITTKQTLKHITIMREINAFNYQYIQGAGDDDEHWSFGITPRMFWEHYQLFLDCNSNKACIELLKRIKDTECKTNENSSVNSCFCVKEFIVNMSCEQVLRRTNNMIYTILDVNKIQSIKLSALDMIKMLYEQHESVCTVIDYVVILIQDTQLMQTCVDFIKEYEADHEHHALKIGVYFVKDSKKYKKSLQNALQLMLKYFNKDKINKIWIYQDKSSFDVNVIGCVAASLILHYIANAANINNKIDDAYWIKREQNNSNEILCLSKTKIRQVMEKFQFIVDGFHPSRLLMKQINNYFLSQL